MADKATTAARPARESQEHVRALVDRAQQGDREALEELYLLHFDRIYSYLHVSVGNRHDAEDLTTQTFLRMLESIKRFWWQVAFFSAWLFRIAHNLAMDHFRAARRWQPEEDVPEVPGETEPSAEAQALQSIGRQSLLELIEDRSEEHTSELQSRFDLVCRLRLEKNMVLIKLLPILGTISGKTIKLMVLALICLGNNRQD